ncbi:shikimate dehydrogenase [Fulvimarina sp. 2208YS6-2-32]|uniref:Shikimate dehydrogenase n=1 Tax=Fulvimarina uroteuthidis TaxID=3098149 RepID=A0ABU5HY48_9HYPH|nr:shikimate dehydrogenase [Fulvimarina sp. 2208YS6-2-32]MDY8108061.1 shikimate dehydrogenase [Fulvimarina sp. 2208YS6-2-32]
MPVSGEPVRLGLIGDAIAQSRAPSMHERAGALIGLDVRYDRLVPAELGASFEDVVSRARENGYRGLNITYPYKERVVPLVSVEDLRVARLGAVNTVLFEPDGPRGYNTDYSGFLAAYRRGRGKAPAGAVCMVGAGGVGRAVAFGLLELGVTRLRLVDTDRARSRQLAGELRTSAPHVDIDVSIDVADGARGADGLINCTPLGMVGHDGTPIPRGLMTGAAWVFDAVYTPPRTLFLRDAEALGLTIMSGVELFFYQGLHAFSLFHGRDLDEADLRTLLDIA